MRALVKFGRQDGDVEIRDVAEPSLAADQVLIEVRAAGVCGSDLHMWREHHSWAIKIAADLGPRVLRRSRRGRRQVKGFALGDRVACETAAVVCGQCVYCLSGNYNLCPNRLGYGALADGAFTRYVAARPQILHHIPDNVPFEHAALTEPICVAYNALVEKTRSSPATWWSSRGRADRHHGAADRAPPRRRYARRAGHRRRQAPAGSGGGTRRPLYGQYPARGPAAVAPVAGRRLWRRPRRGLHRVSKALKQALDLVRPNGRITKIGWGPQPLDFSLDPLVAKAVTLQGSFSHTYPTWERVLTLLSTGQVNLEPVIGGVYPLDEWDEAFTRMEVGDNIKSVLV